MDLPSIITDEPCSSSSIPAVGPLEGHPRYEKVEDLGKGSYGFVQRAWDTQAFEYVAIKFIKRGHIRAEREILNHSILQHPHVVGFRDVFLTEAYLALVMEFAPGGDLHTYVARRGGLGEDEARWFFQQLIFGLDYCHKMGVVNRDIKLENILLDASEPFPKLRICDFGFAKNEFTDSLPHSSVGTPAYIAPEIILGTSAGANSHESRTRYDGKRADVWSSGVMLYVMLFCRYPFDRREDQDLPERNRHQKQLRRIAEVEYPGARPHEPFPRPVSPACADLLRQIMVRDPEQRITIQGICTHPWFTQNLGPTQLEEMNAIFLDLSNQQEVQDRRQRINDILRQVESEARAEAKRQTQVSPQFPTLGLDRADPLQFEIAMYASSVTQ